MLIYQQIYRRSDARRNPQVLYVFGDNVLRKGYGGQAKEMRDEPNAVGIATLYAPYQPYREDAPSIAAQKRIIDEDMKPLFEHVKRGGVVVWPSDGVGTGLAGMPTHAPTTFEYLKQKLAALHRTAELFDHARFEEAYQEAAPHV